MENQDDRTRTLSDALRAVAAVDSGLAPSRVVETRLLDEVRSIARARRRRLMAAALGVAAMLAIVVAVSWRARTGGEFTVNSAASAPKPEMVTRFFPLTYSNLPVSNAQLVRVRVPRAALASFGLAPIDIPASSAGGEQATVPADVLVGEDGVARAIRFVTN